MFLEFLFSKLASFNLPQASIFLNFSYFSLDSVLDFVFALLFRVNNQYMSKGLNFVPYLNQITSMEPEFV